MSDNSKIEWCDASWNPIRTWLKSEKIDMPPQRWGYHCERISPGCKNCYAATMNGRMLPAWGTGLDYTVPNREKVEIFLDEKELLKPLSWKKPRRIFVGSMSDWCATFVTDEMRDRMLAVEALCTQHTFLHLTKRAKECAEYFADQFRMAYIEGSAQSIYSKMHPGESWESVSMGLAVHERDLSHCHLGFSAENQECFDERWSHMRKLAAAGWKVWCSAEPLLGPLSVHSATEDGLECSVCKWSGSEADAIDDNGNFYHCPKCREVCAHVPLDERLCQIVVGGESGHGARPMDIEWVRSILRQCEAAGTAVFCKQIGAKPYSRTMEPWTEIKKRVKLAGCVAVFPKLKNRKGGDPSEWPEDLRVREYPEAE